jgi:phage shock protein E
MPSTVYTPNDVRRLLQDGAQLLDVLAADEFEHDHLPGAINIPLKQLDATSAARLDRNRPVVVYCNDFG